ncbi:hypothetical protein IWW45_004207 [Coemansia sp. RSA 485]|nr:hypothetical protein IWW45_004207 [Coemansia sp. RSA 485]
MRTHRPAQKTKSRQQLSSRDTHDESHDQLGSAISGSSNSALDNLYLTRAPLDANLLSELLGSLQDLPGISPATPCAVDEMAAATAEYSQITNPTVLLGLQSLDELERQAAIHTDHRGSVENIDGQSIFHPQSVDAAAAAGGFGTFDEDELSVALGQIDWSNFIPAALDAMDQHDAASAAATGSPTAFVAPAPTPTPTPVVDFAWERGQPMDLSGANSIVADDDFLAQISRYQSEDGIDQHSKDDETEVEGDMVNAFVDDEEDEDEDDDEDDHQASMELEELSMFSVFLSNMKAFEDFLANLSLNQLRQCAATVNSVLVRRESAMEGLISNRQPRVSRKQQSATAHSSAAGRTAVSASTSTSTSTSAAQTMSVVDDSVSTAAPNIDSSASLLDTCPAQTLASEPAATSGSTSALAPAHDLPVSTVELLREWLSPSTADCVITALQAANLSLPMDQPTDTISRNPDQTSALSATKAITDARKTLNSAAARSGGTNNLYIKSTTAAAKSSAATTTSVSASSNDAELETDSEGVPWLSFMYAQKGKPRRYRIRIDIDRAPLSNIPQSIQANNCVYPRANCSRSVYSGNRWNYETECNSLGWKLAFLNQEILSGRRGLLQTAVNNYRAMVSGRKSRRVTRMEKAERMTAVGGANSGSGSGSGNGVVLTPTSASVSASTPLLALSAGFKRPASAVAASASDNMAGLPPKTKKKKTSVDASAADAHTIHQLASPPPTAVDPGSSIGTADQSSSAIQTSDAPSSTEEPSSLARTASAPIISYVSSSSSIPSQTAKSLTVSVYVSSKFSSIRVSVNFGSIDSSQVDKQFQHQHAVFPRALIAPRSKYDLLSPGRWEFELTCNELAWKLAWLNKARLMGRRPLIQKCLDAYRAKFKVPPWGLLDCYGKDMDGAVDQRFYKYWRPRPGKHLFLEAASNEDKTAKASGSGRDSGGVQAETQGAVVESADAEEGSSARVRAILPRSTDDSLQTTPVPSISEQRPKPQQTATATAKSTATAKAPASVQGNTARQPQSQHHPQPYSNIQSRQQPISTISASRPSTSAQAPALSPSAQRSTQPNLAPKLPVAESSAGSRGPQKANVANSASAKASVFPAPVRPKQHDATSHAAPQATNTPVAGVALQQRPSKAVAQNGSAAGSSSHAARPKTGGTMPNVSDQGQQRSAATNVAAATSQARPVSAARPPPCNQNIGSSMARPVGSVANGMATAASMTAVSNGAPQHSPRPPGPPLPISRPRPRPPLLAQPGPARRLSDHSRTNQQSASALSPQRQPQTQQTRKPRPVQHPTASPRQNAPTTPNPQPSRHPPHQKPQQQQQQQTGRMQTQPKAALQSQKPPSPAPASSSSLLSPKSAKSAKAQAAASMLTDVLRRLAKKDPALATLTGVLDKKTTGSAVREALATSDDDDSPLDAKLAEAEKLIIDMHKD